MQIRYLLGFLWSIELGEMGEEGSSVFTCHTIEAWNEQLEKGNDSKKLVRFFSYPFSFFLLPFFYFNSLRWRLLHPNSNVHKMQKSPIY